MKRCLLWSALLGCAFSASVDQTAAQSTTAAPAVSIPVIQETVAAPFDKYPLGPDSLPQPGVPKGKTFHFELNHSSIFPNTARTITVYVPAQYQAEKPACTFVFLDGIGFNAATVFDNLIARKEMPVTIAIGISSGTVVSASPPDNPRFDRSFEFDSMSDRLARFLLEEVLPEVEKQPTPGGLPIHLSKNPDDRAVAGGSTGGIGSFTIAWQHPEAFRRVFSAIGTFVGMRGGESYYVQVRKSEPRPLRIFMEDGVNDEWAGAEMGDWWMSNLTMNRALEFAGYDVRHVWGAGTHNGTHAASIFPDAVRWLFRDYPNPIVAKDPSNRVLKSILLPHQDWEVAADGCVNGLRLAAGEHGVIFYAASKGGAARLEEAGNASSPCHAPSPGPPFAIGPTDHLYRALPQGGVAVFDATSGTTHELEAARSLHVQEIVALSNGSAYVTTTLNGDRNELWLLPKQGPALKLDGNLKNAKGLALSPDGLWLFVSQSSSRFGISYRVKPDGSVDSREPFYDLYLPPAEDDSGAAQVAMDRDGRAFVATALGIQILDRNGRVAAILPLPGNDRPTGICFGGPDFKTLYVAAGRKIYQRHIGIEGAPPWAPPARLPPWGAG